MTMFDCHVIPSLFLKQHWKCKRTMLGATTQHNTRVLIFACIKAGTVRDSASHHRIFQHDAPCDGWSFAYGFDLSISNVVKTTINHPFGMIFATYFWWFRRWFIIVSTTLSKGQLQAWGLLPEHLQRLLPNYLRRDAALEDHVPVQVAWTPLELWDGDQGTDCRVFRAKPAC